MSLATAAAFQFSPAIQMRAYSALGTLVTSDADDDFLYQMLVALKFALSQANETDTIIVVTMLRSISKVVPALQDTSRYICPLFWLAVALLESSHIAFYVEATRLLCVTLETMDQRGMFDKASVSSVLLDGRSHLENIACQLDHLLSLSFDSSFSFSLASIIFKGVRRMGLNESAEAVLRRLLRVTVKTSTGEGDMTNGFLDSLCPEALGYFIALIPLSTTPATYRRLLKECHVDEAWLPEVGVTSLDDETGNPRVSVTFLGIHDPTTALLVTSFVGAMLMTAQGDDAETQILYTLLSDVALIFPETVAMV